MEQKKAVGIWIRVSTEDQAKGESPEHHEKRARLYAESRGWDVAEVYHLEALTGKTIMAYPETKQMLKDVKSKKISGLIFSKLARLARNTKELLEIADIFNLENCDLVSLHESIDTSTPAGRLFYTMIAAMAQWEREEIVERIVASVPIRAKLGKRLGGDVSLGYKWEKNEVVIDEKYAPIRKFVFELFLQHKRKHTVAKILNDQGYRTRSGAKFTDTTVTRLLRDTMPKGIRKANFTTTKYKKIKPESDWVVLPCPAIISEDLWDECNRILDSIEKKRTPIGPKPKHLLAGYVECATCGKKMYVFHKTKDPAYKCQGCKNRIPVSDMDHIFHEQLKAFLLTDTEVSAYMKKVDSTLSEKQQLLDVVLEERLNVKKKMNELINLRTDGEMTKETFADHFKPLEERLGQINDQLPELEAEIDIIKINHQSSDVILSDAKDLYDHWTTLEYEPKRNIVEAITEKIAVGKEDINIKLAYLPSSPPPALNGGKGQRDH